MESKGLQVIMGKTKCMVSDSTMVSTRVTGKYPCSICYKNVTQNTVTVASIGLIDCESMRIIGAESAQVKLEFMVAHK